jgi:hypothetical protein
MSELYRPRAPVGISASSILCKAGQKVRARWTSGGFPQDITRVSSAAIKVSRDPRLKGKSAASSGMFQRSRSHRAMVASIPLSEGEELLI